MTTIPEAYELFRHRSPIRGFAAATAVLEAADYVIEHSKDYIKVDDAREAKRVARTFLDDKYTVQIHDFLIGGFHSVEIAFHHPTQLAGVLRVAYEFYRQKSEHGFNFMTIEVFAPGSWDDMVEAVMKTIPEAAA